MAFSLGKDTLLDYSLLSSGIFDPPSRVFIDGRDTTQLGDVELALLRNERIGFVFQFYNLVPSLTAIEKNTSGS